LKPSKTYDKYYTHFLTWWEQFGLPVKDVDGGHLCAYVKHLSPKYAPTTLRSRLSAIKCKLVIARDGVTITKFAEWLKTRSTTHNPKKAPTFTADHLTEFYQKTDLSQGCHKLAIMLLVRQGAVIVVCFYMSFTLFAEFFVKQIYGGLRKDEVTYLTCGYVMRFDNRLEVLVPHSKTNQAGKGRVFVYPKHQDPLLCPVAVYDDYASRVTSKPPESRLFRQCHKGVYTASPNGHNWFAKLAAHLASTVGIDGITSTNLKAYGGWKSSGIAESYVDQTLTRIAGGPTTIVTSNQHNQTAVNTTSSSQTLGGQDHLLGTLFQLSDHFLARSSVSEGCLFSVI